MIMRVLLIGGGGREHALAWKLADSPLCSELYCAPGNPGIEEVAEIVPIAVDDFPAIERFIQKQGIEFVVIGPEDPLAMGLTDRLMKGGVKVFGPNQSAARLEGDKWFAKEIMRSQSIPTAEARSFVNADQAEDYVRHRDEPLVVKAAGLAKGKGVSVCRTTDEAIEAIGRIMRQKSFGAAGARVVIEELMTGPECSILAFVSGRSIYVMESAQDHKPIGDGDRGPMTGGMGAYTPTPIVGEEMLRTIEREILVPTIDGLVREGIDYRGVLYAGLMLTPAGPRVLEFNCRFGDPETQPLMMRLESDLLEVMLATAEGTLDQVDLRWYPHPCVSVVAASEGYPGDYPKGREITGIEEADAMEGVKVFHSGTKRVGDQIVTDGGRVLSVTALGRTIDEAQKRAYAAMEKIHFQGMYYRRDIGHQAIGQSVKPRD